MQGLRRVPDLAVRRNWPRVRASKSYIGPSHEISMSLPLNVNWVTISAEERDGYALFAFTGPYEFADFSAIIRGLGEECMRRGATRALFDISKVEGVIPGMERYDLGRQFSEVRGGRLKAGIVAPRDRIDGVSGNMAVNGYARVHVDHDEAAVVRWLLED